MRFKIFLVLLAASALMLSACGNGAATLPELASKFFNALKAQSPKKFNGCVPSVGEIEHAYMLYFANGSKSKSEQKKAALDTAATIRLNLNQSFAKVISQAKDKNIDWNKATLKDIKYQVHQRQESFNEGELILNIDNGSGAVSNVACTAYQINNRWYIVEGPRWQ